MMTGTSASWAIRRRWPTASASRGAGRVRGWDPGPIRPAAFASATRARMTPSFSQWTPVMPPASFSRRRAWYMSPSGIIMAG